MSYRKFIFSETGSGQSQPYEELNYISLVDAHFVTYSLYIVHTHTNIKNFLPEILHGTSIAKFYEARGQFQTTQFTTTQFTTVRLREVCFQSVENIWVTTHDDELIEDDGMWKMYRTFTKSYQYHLSHRRK